MTYKEMFEKILGAAYTHVGEETASYCTERIDDTLYIYFEQSNGKTDWKNNFDFPAKPYRNMKNMWFVHRGFLRVWKVIEPLVEEEIRDPSVNRIYIAGYSHGAPLALLCHEYCMFHRNDLALNHAIISTGFGGPRAVWGFFRKDVKNRFEGFTLVRNCCDIVTHVPPVVFGFRHVGKMLKIGQNSDYTPVEAHYPSAYLKELEEMEKDHGN